MWTGRRALLDLRAGTARLPGAEVPVAPDGDGLRVLPDGPLLVPASWAARARAIDRALAAPSPRDALAAELLRASCPGAVAPGGDTGACAVLALLLAGAEETAPPLVVCTVLVAAATGWGPADIAALPAREVDRLAATLADAGGDDGWTVLRLAAAADGLRELRDDLADALLRRGAAAPAALAASEGTGVRPARGDGTRAPAGRAAAAPPGVAHGGSPPPGGASPAEGVPSADRPAPSSPALASPGATAPAHDAGGAPVAGSRPRTAPPSGTFDLPSGEPASPDPGSARAVGAGVAPAGAGAAQRGAAEAAARVPAWPLGGATATATATATGSVWPQDDATVSPSGAPRWPPAPEAPAVAPQAHAGGGAPAGRTAPASAAAPLTGPTAWATGTGTDTDADDLASVLARALDEQSDLHGLAR